MKPLELLRNPIDRAQSRYLRNRRQSDESLSLAEPLALVVPRLEGAADPHGDPQRHDSYLRRGWYVGHLELWYPVSLLDRFLILTGATFFADCVHENHRIWAFPRRAGHASRRMQARCRVESPEKDPAMEQLLQGHVGPHDRKLAELLDRDLGSDDA